MALNVPKSIQLEGIFNANGAIVNQRFALQLPAALVATDDTEKQATIITIDSTQLAAGISGAGAVAMAESLGSEIPTQGANLTDADVTINISQGAQRVLPAATLTANRIVTLGTTGSPITGESIAILRRDSTAFTLTIKNNAGTTLIVLPVSTRFAAYFQYSGSDWILSSAIRAQ